MSRLNANQIRGLLGSSEFEISCEEEDHYVVLWPGPSSPIRIDLHVADDPADEEGATMLLEAEKVITISLSQVAWGTSLPLRTALGPSGGAGRD